MTLMCEQADMTLRLVEPLRRLLEENGQLNLFEEIELPNGVVCWPTWSGPVSGLIQPNSTGSRWS